MALPLDLPIVMQAAPQGASSMLSMIFPMALMFLIFWMLVWRPQSQERKKHEAFLAQLKIGDEVVTQSGILGKIAGIDDKVVTLEVARGTKLRVLRPQIQGAQAQVLGEAKPTASATATVVEETDSKDEKKAW